jgi:hypothetical protein
VVGAPTGLFVPPVIVIYTDAMYWVFRGKMHRSRG